MLQPLELGPVTHFHQFIVAFSEPARRLSIRGYPSGYSSGLIPLASPIASILVLPAPSPMIAIRLVPDHVPGVSALRDDNRIIGSGCGNRGVDGPFASPVQPWLTH